MDSPPSHAKALARMMRGCTGTSRWRGVPAYKELHDEVGAALAEQHALTPLRGAGLRDWLKRAVQPVAEAVGRIRAAFEGPREGYSPPALAMLNKYKDWRVSTLTVRRDPIGPALNHVLNLVSLGSWNRARSQFGFDTLFHLGLVIGLRSPDGKEHTEVLAEKNEVIKVSHPKALLPTSQILRVPAPVPPMTLEAFHVRQRAGPWAMASSSSTTLSRTTARTLCRTFCTQTARWMATPCNS